MRVSVHMNGHVDTRFDGVVEQRRATNVCKWEYGRTPLNTQSVLQNLLFIEAFTITLRSVHALLRIVTGKLFDVLGDCQETNKTDWCFVLLSIFVGSAWSFGFFIPTTTANDLRLRKISIPNLIHYIIFLILEKEPVSIWVPNKETTGTIFITSLVWHGPWLGIEPGTSRTRYQHSTTRLSRRRWKRKVFLGVVKTLSFVVWMCKQPLHQSEFLTSITSSITW